MLAVGLRTGQQQEAARELEHPTGQQQVAAREPVRVAVVSEQARELVHPMGPLGREQQEQEPVVGQTGQQRREPGRVEPGTDTELVDCTGRQQEWAQGEEPVWQS